jgi:bifunctional non-homologous end joining protein LigD
MRYAPQLAELVKTAPDGELWVHEVKFDGYRIGADIAGGQVTLWSRNGKDWTEAFPEVARAAARLRCQDALLDGEVAILLPDGRTSFQALQGSFGAGRMGELVYFVFDLLQVDGRDLTRLPLEERKQRLRKLVPARGRVIRYVDHLEGRGPEVWREACRLGFEGIVSKRRDAAYFHGRGHGWVKTKCVLRQEFVIGGFTDPEGSRDGLGALVVGVHEGGRLVFAGKVGTGFTQASARALRTRLDRLEQKDCPFATRPPGWLGKHAHWVRPILVAEVVFTEWTSDRKIRHPSFQGLREDKSPSEVVRE